MREAWILQLYDKLVHAIEGGCLVMHRLVDCKHYKNKTMERDIKEGWRRAA